MKHSFSNMQQWDKIFQNEGKYFLKPQENIPKVAKLFKKNKVTKMLDLGCGTGRHLIYFAKKGFSVFGFDISKTAFKLAKLWLKEHNLKANFKIGNLFQKLPYKDNFFDAVIATQAMHHGKTKDIKNVIAEITRILPKNGIIFITCPKKLSQAEIKKLPYPLPKSKQIEKNVWLPLEGPEKGLPHFHFNKTLIRKYFNKFEIHEIKLVDKHYCFIGTKK